MFFIHSSVSGHFSSVQFSSVTQSCLTSATPWTAAHQASLSIISSFSLTKLMSIESVMPYTISSSVVPFSSRLQSFPASGSFPVSQFFASGGQTIGSFSFSISPSSEHPRLILFRTDWLDLLAVQGLSRVFSTTIVQKHQFFGTQFSLWCNSHIHTRLLGKP